MGFMLNQYGWSPMVKGSYTPCVRSKRLSFFALYQTKVPVEFGFFAAGHPLGFVFHHKHGMMGAGDMACTLNSPAGSAHHMSCLYVATVLSKGLEK